jgi:phosphoribosylamine-glycine ligase
MNKRFKWLVIDNKVLKNGKVIKVCEDAAEAHEYVQDCIEMERFPHQDF